MSTNTKVWAVLSVVFLAGIAPADEFADPLPRGALARLGTARFRHEGNYLSLVFTPDGKTVITAGYDGRIQTWDVATGQPRAVLYRAQAEYSIRGIELSSDGKTLAVMGDLAFLLDLDGESKPRPFLGMKGAEQKLVFTPDGRRVVGIASKDQAVHFWDRHTGKAERSLAFPGLPNSFNQEMCISPDGKTLCLGRQCDGKMALLLYDLATGKTLHRWETDDNFGANLVCFTPDSRAAVLSVRNEKTIYWEVASGRRREKAVPRVAFSADGRLMAVLRPTSIHICDRQSGEEQCRLDDLPYYISNVVFSPDGKTLAATGSGTALLFWDVKTGQRRPSGPGHLDRVVTLAFSPDGRRLASVAQAGQILLWETTRGESLWRMALRPEEFERARYWTSEPKLAFSPDGSHLVVQRYSQDVLRLLDVASGKQLRTLDESLERVNRLAYSPDGKSLAVANGPSSLGFLDVSSGKFATVLGEVAHGPLGLRIAFSLDSQMLAVSGIRDVGLRVWDVRRARSLYRFYLPPQYTHPLTFSPDGRSLIVVGPEEWPLIGGANPFVPYVARVLETVTGQERRAFQVDKDVTDGWGSDLTASDGRWLATAVGGRIRVFDVLTGDVLGQFSGHRGHITALAISRDGKRLASGGADSTILLWDTTTLKKPQRPHVRLTAKELDAAWSELAGTADKADAAMLQMSAAPEQARAFLRARLSPTPAPLTAKQLAAPIADLGARRFALREKATQELLKLDRWALSALQQELRQKPSLEVRRRVEEILQRVESAPLQPEFLRLLRSVELLERLGDRETLEELLRASPDCWLTDECRASLSRLR